MIRSLFVVVIVLSTSIIISSNACAFLKKLLTYKDFTVGSTAMYPGLPLGSQIHCDNSAYSDISEVKYGDIVVFEYQRKGRNHTTIRRVVGLPGDRVVTSGQDLFINQKLIEKNLVKTERKFAIYKEYNGGSEYLVAFSKPFIGSREADLLVPSGDVFLMGDNRYNALDSRWLGPIAFDNIVCKKI